MALLRVNEAGHQASCNSMAQQTVIQPQCWNCLHVWLRGVFVSCAMGGLRVGASSSVSACIGNL